MLLLAVDTTTANGSVALAEHGEVVAEARLAAASSYSASLLPAIQELLLGRSRRPLDVDVWAVATGPGAFTGLRVGISTIQGLALASGRPCVGVSALEAWALGVAGKSEAIVVALDALRGDVYSQGFDGRATPTAPPRLGPVDELAAASRDGTAFVGDAAARVQAALAAAGRAAAFPPRTPFLAAEVARIAAREAAAGRTVAPDALRPLYLREAEIRKPRPA